MQVTSHAIHHLTLEADSLAWRCEVAINEGHRVKARRILNELKGVRDVVRRVEVTEELREQVMGGRSDARSAVDDRTNNTAFGIAAISSKHGGQRCRASHPKRISIRDVIAAIVGGSAALVSFWAFVFWN